MELFLAIFSILTVAFVQGNKEARLALQNPDLFEGDITGIDGPMDIIRNAIAGDKFRWPKATIPYVIDTSLKSETDLIKKGMDNYHKNTCVKFIPRTTETDYIKIFSGKGCYSAVGRNGGVQTVSLGNGCLYVGTVVHELGHAVGFYHEQNRSDRDDYLTIYIENVEKGMEFNFDKLPTATHILVNKFDYDSIMIYGNDAFSKNDKDTMAAKNGQKLLNPFDKEGMTDSDIARVKKIYSC